MKFRQPFSLAVTLAWLLGRSCSEVLAADATGQPKSKPSANEIWEQIVSARAALDRAMATDPATLSPDSRAAAQKHVADQASKLEAVTTKFSDDFPGNTNFLRVMAHGAYAVGIGGVLESHSLLSTLSAGVNRITGVEFESEIAKDFPDLGNQTNTLRGIIETNLAAGAIAALRFRPTSDSVYFPLLELAQKAKSDAGKTLVRELITNSLLPSVWMDSAKNILNRQFSIGQPFDLKFTAIDGRKVDLSTMRGKVVLVNFWATDCLPCIGELSELKSIYTQYRDRGFEIVGVSLDDEIRPVLKVIKDKEIAWPNTVDVGGPTNGFAKKCGIFAVPNNWLVDRKGILREIAARRDLEKKVEVLLAEPN